MAFWRRQRTTGATIAPNRMSPSVAIDPQQTGRNVGPGGGKWWGGGPRWFVGSSRGPDTVIEVGRAGDFVPGDPTGAPQPDDQGFPTASRWPGYPSTWTPPYYDTGKAFTGGGGYPGGPLGPYPTGAAPTPFGGQFMGGAMLTGRISTVFACTDLVSRTLATMSLKVLANGAPIVPPPWTENPEPLIYTSIVEAMQAAVNSLLLRGEALIAPTARYPDDMVARWVVLNPDMVEIDAGAGGLLTYAIGGIDIPRSEILHVRYQTWPGEVRGVGPLEACWRNLMGADAMQSWGTALAVSNGIPTAVLQSEVKLTKIQADALKASWAEAAMSRGVLPAVLSGGLTYTPLNLKPREIGLLDLRMFDEQRIASCFGVPLWLVGLPVNDGLTYSTVEDTFDYFWRATLRPIAYNLACAFSGWALPRGEYLRFASEQITEPSISERANIYATLINAGVITTQEARIMEHLPPEPQNADTAVETVRNEGV
jgi:HK97 family phage portal protein